jgi:hypothetical protein
MKMIAWDAHRGAFIAEGIMRRIITAINAAGKVIGMICTKILMAE